MSLLGYLRPRNPTWSISGTGAQFESDVRLSDGNPGVVTALRWLSSGSPAIGQYVSLMADFSAAVVPRLAMLQGMRIEGGAYPVGAKVEIRGQRAGDVGFPYNLGGNSQSAVLVEFADGDVGVVFEFDEGLDPIVAYEVRLYNDVAGVTWATATTYPQIGEIDLWEAVPVRVAQGYSDAMESRAQRERTLDAQMHEVDWTSFRSLQIALTDATARADVMGDGIDGTDLERVRAQLVRGGNRVLVVLYPGTDLRQRSATFGVALPAPFVHISGQYYRGGYTVEQVPAVVE
jgi:hypothetical protein